jgi:hypothetical protein
VRHHYGAAVFEYRLFPLIAFARRVLALAAPAQAAAVPEAVERDALIDVARTALEAYEVRFESVYGRYNGPIDDEMKALKAAIDRLAGGQGDVSGEGEGS